MLNLPTHLKRTVDGCLGLWLNAGTAALRFGPSVRANVSWRDAYFLYRKGIETSRSPHYVDIVN